MAKKSGIKAAPARVLVLSPDECREIDRRCVADFGLPTLVLMENAAVQVTTVVLELLEATKTPRVLIVAGTGNNGGDGLAVARHLANAGVAVAVVLVGDIERLSPDAAVHRTICERMEIGLFRARTGARSELRPALRHLGAESKAPTIVVDGLFGTGLSRTATGAGAAAIERMNELGERGSKIVSIDIPSGINASTGQVEGVAVRADVTVTLVGIKTGMFLAPAIDHLGEVIVADIGVPRTLLEDVVRGSRVKRIHAADQGRRRPISRRSI